jgi:hypothetical protein
MNTPLLGPSLFATSQSKRVSNNTAPSMLDQASLQRFLGSNIPTVGIDAVAAGADPLGLTDSTSAIQNILNGGNAVYLRAGTYLISATLGFGSTIKPMLIYSDSLATLKQTLVGQAILAGGGSDCLIKGIKFLGNSSLYAVDMGGVAAHTWMTRCLIQNCTNGVVSSSGINWSTNCSYKGNTTDINLQGGQLMLDMNVFENPPAVMVISGGAYISRGNYGLPDHG